MSDNDSLELESSGDESCDIILEEPPLLVDACLKTIAKNFCRYYLAFTTTKNEILSRMLEFLQRRYSYDILIRLKNRKNLPEEYADVLINKYLRILETTWLRNYSWEKVSNKMVEIGNNIQEIILRHEHFGKPCEERPWQKVLCYFPNLRSITFDDLGNCCYGSILKSVANFCPNIEEIDFKNSCITLEVAKNFCKSGNENSFCEKLKRLRIATRYGRLGALAYFIANFKTLEIIENPDLPFVLYSMHKSDLSSLDKVEPYNIRKLNLIQYAHDSFLADLLKVCLSVCPHLKSVSCGLVAELDFFPNLPELEQLKIINYKEYSKINIDNILKSRKEILTSLNIVNCALSISVLAESCPRVKKLLLKKVNLCFDDDSTPLFNSLSSCSFESINVSMNSKAISLILSSSCKLVSLAFRSCNMFSSEVEMLILKCCKSYSIRRISFCSTDVREQFVRNVLLNCTSLTYLNVSCCLDSDEEDELLNFAEILPNKPEISFNNDYDFDCDKGYHDYDDFYCSKAHCDAEVISLEYVL